MKYAILDCYVDEPACLGVPPFIAPYGRSICGALIHAGIAAENIHYLTIDDLRPHDYRLQQKYEIIFTFGGAVVPGRYLGARIGTAAEMQKIFTANNTTRFAAGGPISTVLSENRNVNIVKYDLEFFAYQYALGSAHEGRRTTEQINLWNKLGAAILREHPWFPHVICEVETSRGCPRQHHCSFCSEGLFGTVEFRDNRDILLEIDELITQGITRIRLGRQADILQHGSSLSNYKNGFPRPEPSYAIEFFKELQKLRESKKLSVVTIDNANPGTIINYPSESRKIIESIAHAVTPGDTMALGVESFDAAVVRANNLKIEPDDVIRAIEIINEAGCERVNGIPRLLPGINLIHGLKEENRKTFEKNHAALKDIIDNGLLIKRINIRQLTPYPGTQLAHVKKTDGILRQKFEYFRAKIREDIDIPLMKKIYPSGTIIHNAFILEHNNEYSYGKEIVSYAITCRFPEKIVLKSFTDALVTGHRERSLTTIPLPASINTLSTASLRNIPGISNKGADDIILARPFSSMAEAEHLLTNVPHHIKKHLQAQSPS